MKYTLTGGCKILLRAHHLGDAVKALVASLAGCDCTIGKGFVGALGGRGLFEGFHLGGEVCHLAFQGGLFAGEGFLLALQVTEVFLRGFLLLRGYEGGNHLHSVLKDHGAILLPLNHIKAVVDINQGIDIRMMTERKAEMLKRLRIKNIHFAWDRYEDKDLIVPKLKLFKDVTQFGYRKMTVFMLTNFNTTFEQDLERVYTIRDLGYNPFVMIYEKYLLPSGHNLIKLQRWVNNRRIFRTCNSFDEYNAVQGEKNAKYKLF